MFEPVSGTTRRLLVLSGGGAFPAVMEQAQMTTCVGLGAEPQASAQNLVPCASRPGPLGDTLLFPQSPRSTLGPGLSQIPNQPLANLTLSSADGGAAPPLPGHHLYLGLQAWPA